MTAIPETRYQCDRCNVVASVPMQNIPAHARMSGPPDWLCLQVGVDPGTPPTHLCSECAQMFQILMTNHRS